MQVIVIRITFTVITRRNMMLDAKTHRAYLVPNGVQGKMTCLFAVVIPMVMLLTTTSIWLYAAKQELDLTRHRATRVNIQLLPLADLIINLNTEREFTAVYVSARSSDTIEDAKYLLDDSYIKTDNSLVSVYRWPGSEDVEGYMYKSSFMFSAILQAHRDNLQHGAYFWDEVQFYTDIIDVALTWFMQEVKATHGMNLSGHLLAYSYLLGSINYMGAEQALCSVFYSAICFTHKETFYFANFSLGGEAVFRLYRHSFPGVKDQGWSFKPHREFFPELGVCRTEIISDIKYSSIAIDTSQCDYSRKNETIFSELDMLTINENQVIVSDIQNILTQQLSNVTYNIIWKSCISSIVVLYFFIVHLSRCCAIKYRHIRSRRKWKKYDEKYGNFDQEKVENFTSDNHIASDQFTSLNSTHIQPTVIGFEDYSDCNCTTNYIKVATV